ncbi:hypothetical protein KP509_04G002300 [Ceratopteris richardii]|nr:hypothetical protein KP509_04G002300 [Ceratopteris richardii]
MCKLCIIPEIHTFVALLKACAETENLKTGYKMHTQAVSIGIVESDLFVGNSLIDMYAKCDELVSAENVFNRLPVRDLVSWNTLISGLAKHKGSMIVLLCVKKMRKEGISPDATTFVCSLNACTDSGNKQEGLEFHSEIEKKGLLNKFVGNALVDMYSKYGSLLDAQNVFDSLPNRDVIAYNSLISGYAELGFRKEVFNLFDKMQHAGLFPNAITFVGILKACRSGIDPMYLAGVHAEISRKGLLGKNLYVGNALIDTYCRHGLLVEAHEVLESLPIRNVISWTALIAGYVEFGIEEKALLCFDHMELDGVSANSATFICILRACSSIGLIIKGIIIHAEIGRQGVLEKELSMSTAIVDLYVSCGLLGRAEEVFDKLQVRDLILWTTLMDGYCKQGYGNKALECFRKLQLEGFCPNAYTYVCSLNACGQQAAAAEGIQLHSKLHTKGLVQGDVFIGNALVDMYAKCGLLTKAQEVFDNLPVRDVVSWTTLISAYAEHKSGEIALSMFEKMQYEGTSPNTATYICILKACSAIGAVDKGEDIHHDLTFHGYLDSNLPICNALVNMYAKCGSLGKALDVFYQLPEPDVVSWTSLIVGYMKVGQNFSALHVFDTMNRDGTIPDPVAFLSVLTACSRTGVLDKGKEYLQLMTGEYGLKPTLKHHTCMAHLLSSTGHLDQAFSLMENIPFRPDIVFMHAILDASKKWGDSNIGRRIFEHTQNSRNLYPSEATVGIPL